MRHFFATGLLLLTTPLYSQQNDYCVKTKSLKASDLNNVFPFNKSVAIEVVSYKTFLDDTTVEKSPFAVDGKIDRSQLVEQKILTQSQVDELVDILYDYTFDPKIDSLIYAVSACFWPRNAVLFENAKGKIIARLEVCFQCWRSEFYPERFTPVDFCDGKMDMLMGFMQSAGIRFGLERPAGIKK